MNNYDPTMAYTLALAIREAYRKYSNNHYVINLPGWTVKDFIYVFEAEEAGYVFFGFTATGNIEPYPNLVALRGTQTGEEGLDDIDFTFTDCVLPSTGGQSYGQVAQGAYDFYVDNDEGLVTSLADSFKNAIGNLDGSRFEWYIGGHSLGGAMATLGALDAVVSGSYNNSNVRPKLYTYGSMYVGDQTFVSSFAKNGITEIYRVANLADWVPGFTGIAADTPGYAHVGLDCTYLWQTGGDWANHSLENNYLECVKQYRDVIKFGPRKYPQ
jgi:predicted lipase